MGQVPSLARVADKRALAWHTGCEQEPASGAVFAAAKQVRFWA
jgi:hypothetical protein